MALFCASLILGWVASGDFSDALASGFPTPFPFDFKLSELSDLPDLTGPDFLADGDAFAFGAAFFGTDAFLAATSFVAASFDVCCAALFFFAVVFF
mgnify:CR=1 FL=1